MLSGNKRVQCGREREGGKGDPGEMERVEQDSPRSEGEQHQVRVEEERIGHVLQGRRELGGCQSMCARARVRVHGQR